MAYPKFALDGAVVVITGGARGIGRAGADLFTGKGATVCIGDLDGAEYTVDVTSRDSFSEFIDAVIDRFGRIDVLVNNAGVMPLGDFLSEEDAIRATTFDVNVWGLINGMRPVMPHMIERGSGHVVNVASMAGKLVVAGMAVYNASKFAAVGLSAAVREEYRGTGVSVTAVLPSAVRTRLASGVQLGHGLPTVDPEDAARAIVVSVDNRRAEITVPRHLAGWELLNALVPERVMRLGRKMIGDRRALTWVDHDARAAYEESIRAGTGGPQMTTGRQPKIVIIGAGIAGIATGVTLQRAGFHDFSILEKGSDVGGVWHWNRYPGLTCDVPSQLYQFSLAPKPDWTGMFAPGEEIQRYLRDVVDQFGLDAHLRLNATVVSAVFTGAGWRIETAEGTVLQADFVIAATGLLHHPYTPAIPGLDTFAGDVVHTARWDDDIVTDGRRIAVIGTGSTGVQIVSALQAKADRIAHFVRTPQWVMWAPMELSQPRLLGAVLRRLPATHRGLYNLLLWASGILADITTRPSWRRRLVQAYARWSLRVQVPDPALRDQLTPDYQPLCKRQVVSGSYYRALRAANAELVTAAIEEITPSGIRTADGREIDIDLLVFATGFQTHNYMRPMKFRGRDGLSIDDAWAKGPRAYRMTAIPGFPNFFTVLGPNSPTGSISLQYSAELTARYITHWLRRFRDGEIDTVEVTEEATTKFNDDVAAALGPTVWNTGCNSWYLTDEGNVDLWPYDRKTMTGMLTEPDERDYHVTVCA
jgi:cation diffusion facilitator CzcD-associated flavoprotein CzcO/short-subunit dehydrogenase